jgi:hypothetical protein
VTDDFLASLPNNEAQSIYRQHQGADGAHVGRSSLRTQQRDRDQPIDLRRDFDKSLRRLRLPRI